MENMDMVTGKSMQATDLSIAYGHLFSKAAKRVAKIVNKLAAKGKVSGSLQTLCMISMHTEPHQLPHYLIMGYIALTPEGLQEFDNNSPEEKMEEGALPNSVVTAVENL